MQTKQAIFNHVWDLTDYEVMEAALELRVIDEGEEDEFEIEELRRYVREAIEERQAEYEWESRISW